MKKAANLLIVDDNKDLLNTFALILKRKGYLVDIALDGFQALEKFTNQKYDVVLMDVIMPGMSGIDALHRMRQINPSARILLMTAYCEEDQLNKALNEGAFGALYKPINIARLMDLLGEITGDPSVLVVDDDENFRHTMASMLETQKYKVITAANGVEAIKLAREKSINLAFIDIKMSVMDGLTTSIKLKEINPDTVIVMMTGYREEVKDIVDEAAGKGVVKCLYKPFNMADIQEVMVSAG